ncbi:MAG: hypothetical protein VX938_12910, partial [Myxococcota bacterium]|nr:hypothetical protein [Myxococcota bacterium]
DCTTEGEACAEDAECCSGDCGDDGLCAAAPEPPPCAEEGEACSDDDDCCSGDCGEGGLCVAATPPPGGQCDNEADLAVVATKDIDAIAGDAALACLSDPENTEACVEATLMSEDVGLSAGCAGCYSALVTCSVENCIVECVNPNPDGGPLGDECTCCRDENGCTDTFYTCSGLVDDNPAPDCEVEPEPPICAAEGEACTDDADCCAGVCGAGGTCETTPEPPTCAPEGEACTDNADCCTDLCGAGGVCEVASVDPAGACDNEADLAVVASKDVDSLAGEAALACLSDPDNTEACVESALTADDVGLTSDCAGCYSALVTCSVENCIVECANPDPDGGPLGDECTCCRDENGCTGAFYSCSGLVDDNPAPNCEPAP